MADTTQILTVGMPTLAVLVGILVNNSRLSDLRSYIDMRFVAMDQRLDAIVAIMDARFAEQKAVLLRVGQVMDARLRHLEENR